MGRGALDTVFRAVEIDSGEAVAVRELTPVRRPDAKVLERCRREAAVLGQIDHPGVPKLITQRVQGRSLYLVQELVEGSTLAEAVPR